MVKVKDEEQVDEDKLINNGCDKFAVCMFLVGSNKKLCSKCINGLNNNCLAGNEHCATRVDQALVLEYKPSRRPPLACKRIKLTTAI